MSYRIPRISFTLFLIILSGFSVLGQYQAIPALESRVTDQTGTLTNQQKRSLEAELEAFEANKGSQVVVLIISSTDPEAIETYSMRVAEEWQIGRGAVDDGVLLLIAKDDRKVRIEVGYGLEGAIPDAYAKRIIENIIIPNFRQGAFYNGIEDGVGAIMALAEGEDLPAITKASKPGGVGGGITILMIVFFIVLSILKAFLKKSKYKWVAVGLVTIVAGLVLGSFIFAGIGFALSSMLMFSSATTGSSGRYYGGGGFYGGGGSSFGGGGFSGGGGSFGGGGASGGW